MIQLKKTIPVEWELLKEECPKKTAEIFAVLRNSNSPYRNWDEEKFNTFYTFSTFRKKAKSEEEKEERRVFDEEVVPYMLWNERYTFELSKLRTNIIFSVGHFTYSDRISKKHYPQTVLDEFIKMLNFKIRLEIENTDEDRSDVLDSLPELTEEQVEEYNLIKDQIEQQQDFIAMLTGESIDNEESEDVGFDIDDILDKISDSGMESLTEEEKDFLNSQNNDDTE